MRELPVLQDRPNCAPCPIGKTLGRRECPGVKIRRLLGRMLQALLRYFRPR